jgi:hypothetical protein
MDDDAPLVELTVVLLFLVDILGFLLEPSTNGGRQLLGAIAEATEHQTMKGNKSSRTRTKTKTQDKGQPKGSLLNNGILKR